MSNSRLRFVLVPGFAFLIAVATAGAVRGQNGVSASSPEAGPATPSVQTSPFVRAIADDAASDAPAGETPAQPAAQDASGDFPTVLDQADAERYRDIFALQREGKWKEADALIEKLDNEILMGHVLYQRYMHPTDYRSKFSELKAFMDDYADHPGAYRIYRLALRRRPRGGERPDEPVPLDPEEDEPAIEPARAAVLSEAERDRERQARSVKATLRYYAHRGRPQRAEKRLWAAERAALFDEVEFDQEMDRVASAYYFDGNEEKALTLAKRATRSRPFVVNADWIAGLSAWKSGDYASAGAHFEALTRAEETSDWVVSAGAYWAARSYLMAEQPEKVSAMLEQAARYKETFYGLIAARQLGEIIELDWSFPDLSPADYETLLKDDAARRAVALFQTGASHLADQELRYSWRRSGRDNSRDYLGLAAHLKLPATQLEIAMNIAAETGTHHISALYPVPDWEPQGGFSVDRAMVYAFIRQESGFKSGATSHAGARGLMQLMPATASFIARDRSLYRSNRLKLYEPDFNMSLGQRYIEHLFELDHTERNLFLIATAYNGGPGNLSRWLKRTKHKRDWLLFIESIPARETRNYVERVMANLWIYRMRLGQPTPTLNAIAAGEWPIYTPLDRPVETAADAAAVKE